jgi:secreted trypsin-like serine protease
VLLFTTLEKNENIQRINIISDDICATTWDKDADGFTDAGKDACQGDSGGALICNRDGFATVVGVVSRGNGCAYKGEPGLYTSTFVTKDWIVETVNTQ